MLNYKHLWQIFFAIPTLVFFLACSDNSGLTESGKQIDDVTIVSLSPIGGNDATRSSSSTNDIYAINVYYDADKDGVCETHYAYGLFDNKDDMIITLLNTYYYKFECTLVKDGANTLYRGSGDLYGYPFQTNSSTTTYLNNVFTYNTTYFSGLGNGKAHIASLSGNPSSSNCTSYPSVNRFYGEYDSFKPSPTNKRVTIELKRCVFGAKYVITGVSEGTVNVKCTDIRWDKNTTVPCESEEQIYSYNDVYDCWKNEPDLQFTITMNYTSNRGSWWNISGSQTVKFKRNVMTTVYINVDPDKSSGIFNITEEAMGSDNDINIGLNTNGTIDIVVDPNEEQ